MSDERAVCLDTSTFDQLVPKIQTSTTFVQRPTDRTPITANPFSTPFVQSNSFWDSWQGPEVGSPTDWLPLFHKEVVQLAHCLDSQCRAVEEAGPRVKMGTMSFDPASFPDGVSQSWNDAPVQVTTYDVLCDDYLCTSVVEPLSASAVILSDLIFSMAKMIQLNRFDTFCALPLTPGLPVSNRVQAPKVSMNLEQHYDLTSNKCIMVVKMRAGSARRALATLRQQAPSRHAVATAPLAAHRAVSLVDL